MDGQYYTIDGVKYDRVTNILGIIHDTGLEQFQRAKGFDYVDSVFAEAAERGKIFHSAMKLVADGKFSGMIADSFAGSEMMPDIQLGIDWLAKNVKDVLYTEARLANKSLKYAGTVDLIYRDHDDKIVLLDWKTGSVMSPKYRLQLGAYAYMAEQNLKITIDRRVILQVHGGKLKQHPVKTDKAVDKNLFDYCLYLAKEIK